MGTHIFFEKDEETPVDELYAKCESYYEYVAKTNKVLRMNRVLLKSKQEGEEDEEREIEQINDQEDPVKAESYQAALDQLLRSGRPPPRQISTSQTSTDQKQYQWNDGSWSTRCDRQLIDFTRHENLVNTNLSDDFLRTAVKDTLDMIEKSVICDTM